MPNLNQLFREEIVRLTHRQIKPAVGKVHRDTVRLKHDVAALKRTVAALAKDNRRILAVVDRLVKTQPAPAPEAADKARITGKGIRSLRRKMKLSQADFGRLIGVTAQAVVNMEKKNGPLAARKVTRAAILAIRGLGAREAKARLAETKPVTKPAKGRNKKRA